MVSIWRGMAGFLDLARAQKIAWAKLSEPAEPLVEARALNSAAVIVKIELCVVSHRPRVLFNETRFGTDDLVLYSATL